MGEQDVLVKLQAHLTPGRRNSRHSLETNIVDLLCRPDMIQRLNNCLNTRLSFFFLTNFLKDLKTKFGSLQVLNLVDITIITEIKTFV